MYKVLEMRMNSPLGFVRNLENVDEENENLDLRMLKSPTLKVQQSRMRNH